MEMLSKRGSRTSCNFGIAFLVVYKDNKMRPQESVVLSLMTTKKLTNFQHYLSQMYYHTVSSVTKRKESLLLKNIIKTVKNIKIYLNLSKS